MKTEDEIKDAILETYRGQRENEENEDYMRVLDTWRAALKWVIEDED